MSSLLSTNEAPIEYYRQLDKMARAAVKANLNYTMIMKNCNKDGSLMLNYEQFETVVKTMDPLVSKNEMKILVDLLQIDKTSKIAINLVTFSRELDKMVDNLKVADDFFKAIAEEITKKQMTIEDFFQLHSNSRIEGMTSMDFEKFLGNINFKVNKDAFSFLFRSLNSFDADFKITKDQFVKQFTEFKSKHESSVKQAVSPPSGLKDDSIEKVAPTFHKLREEMLKSSIENLKAYFLKSCKVEDKSYISKLDFERAIRDIMPTITFKELTQLSETLSNQGRVRIELPDEFLRESIRFMPNSKSKPL
jgi:hypothetical protein